MKGDSEEFNNVGSSSVKQVDFKNTADDAHNLPMKGGQPNSVTQKTKDGTVISERYYDENGDAYLDIDYTDHGNPKTHPHVPHQHSITFVNGEPRRGKDKEVK